VIAAEGIRERVEEAAYRARKSASLFMREAIEKALEEVERGVAS
jgi:predicted DNA-binding protein